MEATACRSSVAPLRPSGALARRGGFDAECARMKTPLLAIALLCVACASQAGEGVDLVDARAIAKANASLKTGEAPFAAGRRDTLPVLLMREEQERRGPQGACNQSAADVCYDMSAGRIVYRPARRFMPSIDGLTAESISLRHDRIILKYTFR